MSSYKMQSLKSYQRVGQTESQKEQKLFLPLKIKESLKFYIDFLKSYFGSFMFWFYIIGGYLVSRSTFVDGLLAPFGLALVLALKKENSRYLIPGMLGFFMGELSRTGLSGVFIVAIIMTFIFTIDYYKDKLVFNDYVWWIAAAMIYFIIKFLPVISTGVSSFEVYKLIFETGLLIVVGMIFTQAISQLDGKSWPKGESKEEVIPLVFLLVLILAGFRGITLGGFEVQNIIAGLMVLTLSYAAGGGIGAAAGALIGTVLVLSHPSPATIGALTLGGFLGGVFNDFKKPGSMVGFLIGAGLMIFYLSRPFELIDSLEDLVIAALGFLLIPGGVITYTKKFFPLNYDDRVKNVTEKNRLGEVFSRRTGELSSLFKELSVTFEETHDNAKEDKGEIEDFMERVAGNICSGCKKFDYCWEDNFFVIYRGIVETLSNLENRIDGDDLENKDLSDHLVKHCLRPSGLKKDLKSVYDVFKIDAGWKKEIYERQEFVAQQLKGIGDIMEDISRELESELKDEEELEENIFNELIENNISVKSLKLHKSDSSKVIVDIELKKCKSKDQCDRVVNHCVSNLLGEKLMVVRNSCFHRKDDTKCKFKLRPFKAYNIITGISQLVGEKGNTCGDSYLSRQLESGQHLLLLSDGMGKGKNAKGESNTAVKLLEKMLSSGFKINFVIKNVNAILNLRSQAETFATMDMALIDMLNGEGEFYKAGAMPSYILKGGNNDKEKDVQKIEGQSLPAGILNNVEPTVKRFRLTADDTLVMVSDGVFSPGEKEDWLKKELFDLKDTHPQVMADELSEKVKRRYYGEIKDDVTIMVSKSKENFKTRG